MEVRNEKAIQKFENAEEKKTDCILYCFQNNKTHWSEEQVLERTFSMQV